MAEKSKKRGEFGEEIVERLLTLIGWDTLLKGRDFACIKPIPHAISTRGRTTHGIDFIYQYDCPLFNNNQEFVLVSSKFNDSYPSNPVSKFKLHLQDIAQALDCFKKSDIRNELKSPQKTAKYTGVIFWLDNGEQNQYDDVIDRLSDFRVDNDLEFDSVYLVDNNRADFLYDTISYVTDRFENMEVEFYIPSTGYNNTIQARRTSSPILPVQYINSSILPFKVVQDVSTEILILNVIDNFERDHLTRLISLAQKLTEGWANKIFILFPEFNENLQGEVVENVKSEFRDQDFVRKVEINTFHPDFRNA
ncbi:MAG: hypothetical protein KDJ97_08550 [Anaerolineae bacterium]|nr:hypothetical protein [Anaerolineae bacterium]MCB9109031.1 hypothetical protein [Anaerolineales bacterium]